MPGDQMKRILPRTLIILFIVFLAGVILCSLYIWMNGPKIVINTLNQLFERPVALNHIHFVFPFGFRISDLQLEGVLKVKDIQVQIGLPDFVRKRVRLLFVSLTEPVVLKSFEVGKPVQEGAALVQESNPLSKHGETPAVAQGELKNSPFEIVVDYLVVDRGTLEFADASDKTFQVTLKDITLKAQHVSIPWGAMKTQFAGNALLFKNSSPFSGSRLQAQGWVDFYEKDMVVKVQIDDPRRNMNLLADLTSQKNDMDVSGKLWLKNFSIPEDPQTTSFSLKDMIFAALPTSGIEVTVDFHFKTKMDDFKVDAISFAGNISYERPPS